MIISAFSDGERKDKIAEFYDTDYPCSFLRGLLTEAQEQGDEVNITFSTCQSQTIMKSECFYSQKPYDEM